MRGAGMVLMLAAALMMALAPLAAAQNTANYSEQGGDSWKVGGTLTVLDGGVLNIDDGGAITYDTGRPSRLLHSLTAAGAAFLGTEETEAILGSGSYDIPANLLAAGDVVRFIALVKVGLGVSDDTLRLRARVGGLAGTAVVDTTAIDVVTSDTFRLSGEISMRTVGASGTGYADGALTATLDAADVQSVTGTALSSLDTTAAVTLAITGVWDASAADTNSATLQAFSVWLN